MAPVIRIANEFLQESEPHIPRVVKGARDDAEDENGNRVGQSRSGKILKLS